jgi:beta-lactam-binding protein with PASTA domain
MLILLFILLFMLSLSTFVPDRNNAATMDTRLDVGHSQAQAVAALRASGQLHVYNIPVLAMCLL